MNKPQDMQVCSIKLKGDDHFQYAIWDTGYSMYGAGGHFQLAGGEARHYRLPNGYGLSAQADTMLHAYPFAWEIAVCRGMGGDGLFEGLAYDTPLTDDVEVYDPKMFQEIASFEMLVTERMKAEKDKGEDK